MLLAHIVLVNHYYRDSLPTQYIFRTVPYICLQSTVHQSGFYSCFLLPLGTHWIIFSFQCTARGASSSVAGGDSIYVLTFLLIRLLCVIPHLLVNKRTI